MYKLLFQTSSTNFDFNDFLRLKQGIDFFTLDLENFTKILIVRETSLKIMRKNEVEWIQMKKNWAFIKLGDAGRSSSFNLFYASIAKWPSDKNLSGGTKPADQT